MRHRGKRRDSNHSEIAAYAESLGFSVLDLSQLNRGLDLLVAIRHSKTGERHTVRIEIKDGLKPPSARALLESEQSVFDNWQGRCEIWKSKADVDALHDELRNA